MRKDLLMTNMTAIEGTVMAVQKKRERLLKTLPLDLLETAEAFGGLLNGYEDALYEALSVCSGQQELIVQGVGRGGIFAALWELGKNLETGMTVHLKKIPIRQETIEICEVLDLNPYELLSGGCSLIAADNGNDVREALEAAGIRVSYIGKLTDSNDRIILNGEGVRYLNRPEPDEVRKLEEA